MIFTVSALLLVGAANYWLFFHAPKMQVPNSVNFVLVESKKEAEQKAKAEEKEPWYVHAIIYTVVITIYLIDQAHHGFGLWVIAIAVVGCGIYLTIMRYELWILQLILLMQRPRFSRLEPLRVLLLRLVLRLRILRPINGPQCGGPSRKSPSGQSSSTAA